MYCINRNLSIPLLIVMKHSFSAFLLFWCVLWGIPAAAQQTVWTNNLSDKIQELSEESIIDLVDQETITPWGIAVDNVREKIYWTNVTEGTIKSFDLNGDNINTLQAGLDLPRGITIDVLSNTLYWAEAGHNNQSLKRMNIGDETVSVITDNDIVSPYHVAFDRENGYVYWADNALGQKTISRIQADGSNRETIISSINQVSGIALDTSDYFIYWADFDDDVIYRAETGGTDQNIEIFYNIENEAAPWALSFDSENNQLFWTDYLNNSINIVNTETLASQEWVSNVTTPSGISTFTIRLRPESSNQQILVSNNGPYSFQPSDFGISDESYFVKIESLPEKGTLEFEGSVLSVGDNIQLSENNNPEFAWNPPLHEHGYSFTAFNFRVLDDIELESVDAYTMQIDLAKASVDITGTEGWRLLSSPAVGESIGSFFSTIWTQGFPGSDAPQAPSANVYNFDHESYQWDDVNASDEFIRGRGLAVYVFEDHNYDGTEIGFPRTLHSAEEWTDLIDIFNYSNLFFDDEAVSSGGNYFLLSNPHPISLDFCEFTRTNIADNVHIWDPNFNDGEYRVLSCSDEVVHIAPYQAFWVRTTELNPQLSIPEIAYLDQSEDGYFKERNESQESFIVNLAVSGEANEYSNHTRVLFSNEGGLGLDQLDAPRISSEGLAGRWLSLYTLDEAGTGYSFQSLPMVDEDIRVPVALETTEPGTYSLSWNLPGKDQFSGRFFLRDNFNESVIEMDEGGTFTIKTDASQTRKRQNLTPLLSIKNLPKKNATSIDPRFELIAIAEGSGQIGEPEVIPAEMDLKQNYPNPFNPSTIISYELPQDSAVRLEVYDLTGRQVATIVNGNVSAGRHSVNFDAENLSSGIYLYRLQAGNQIITRKLTVLK